MSFLLGAGASLLSAVSEQLVSYLEYEVQQAELEEQQQQHCQLQHQARTANTSPPRRVSLPSHRLLSSPTPPSAPQPAKPLPSPIHSPLSTSAILTPSTAPTSIEPTCTCTTDHTTADDYSVTPFTIEFATALSDHPSTFHCFPACCVWSSRFHLSAVQLVHARRLLVECAVFSRLRREVREAGVVSEFEFWRVYFLLLHNVHTRERTQGTKQRRRSRRERRSGLRGAEETQQDKENVSPIIDTNTDALSKERADERPAEQLSEEQQCEGQADEDTATAVEHSIDSDEQQRERERAVWMEVDRLLLTLTAARPPAPTAHALDTPAKTSEVESFESPDGVDDSACSDYYVSPSPQQSSGLLFHRLSADEQRSVAHLLAPQQQHAEREEEREVSRLVFSPTPSLNCSLSGEEWEKDERDVDGDSSLELDLSSCSVSSFSDSSAHSEQNSTQCTSGSSAIAGV